MNERTPDRIRDAGSGRGHDPRPTAHARPRRGSWCGGHSIIEYVLVTMAIIVGVLVVRGRVDKEITSSMEDIVNTISMGGLVYGL